MSLFSQLIDEVADQKNHSLSDVLLKAKVLASKLRGRKFRQWIDAEINGYSKDDALPEYRILGASLIGTFAGYFSSRLTTPMSVSHLEASMYESFSKHKERHGVSYVEDLIKNEGDIGMHMDGYAINYLREHGVQVSDMLLNNVFKKISPHSCQQLLNGVRSRLLDFLLELREQFPNLETDDSATANLNPSDVDAAVENKVYHQCNVYEGVEMRDNYQAGQAGAMGPGAQAQHINFVQILRNAIGENSLGDLAKELEQLRGSMLAESKTADQDSAVAAIAQAEDSAKRGDAKGVLHYLKSGGKWAFDVATKLGTAVASKAIEKSMGI